MRQSYAMRGTSDKLLNVLTGRLFYGGRITSRAKEKLSIILTTRCEPNSDL
jgi:hypothetical protein